jgi:hypothetical protein
MSMVKLDMDKIKKSLEKNGKYWVAFVGDSITSTEWVHPNWREMVEYVLKDKFEYDWGIKTFNFAYDGSTSRDLLEKVDELTLINPNIVIMLTGANDPFHGGVSPSELKENVLKIKEEVESFGTDFVLSSDTCPMDDWAEKKCLPYVEALNGIDNNSIKLFEISKTFPKDKIYTFISEQDIPEERVVKGKIDFWHPNQLGNAYIAKVILNEIWGIDFNPEKYIEETARGEKLPRY